MAKVSSLSATPIEALADTAVTAWLETLLQHFSISELGANSDRDLADLIEQYGVACAASGDGDCAAKLRGLSGSSGLLLSELKRRIVRLAGAHLDSAFVDMAPEVIDAEDAEAILLAVAGRQLKGVRYQGEIYRLTESFKPAHRLQAFCLGQTLSEQSIPYIITQSATSFTVWVNIRALPPGGYRRHLVSNASPINFGQ